MILKQLCSLLWSSTLIGATGVVLAAPSYGNELYTVADGEIIQYEVVDPSEDESDYDEIEIIIQPAPSQHPSQPRQPEPVHPVVHPTQPSHPSQPSHHQSARGVFLCDSTTHLPTTFFNASEGNLPVIRWVSQYFSGSGYDPVSRCQEVSRRFQRYYETGVLNYITTGIVNRLPVVCVAGELGGPCGGVLFTLKPEENASQVIQQLFDISYANAGPLYENDSRVYLDVEQHLSNLTEGL